MRVAVSTRIVTDVTAVWITYTGWAIGNMTAPLPSRVFFVGDHTMWEGAHNSRRMRILIYYINRMDLVTTRDVPIARAPT